MIWKVLGLMWTVMGGLSLIEGEDIKGLIGVGLGLQCDILARLDRRNVTKRTAADAAKKGGESWTSMN